MFWPHRGILTLAGRSFTFTHLLAAAVAPPEQEGVSIYGNRLATISLHMGVLETRREVLE